MIKVKKIIILSFAMFSTVFVLNSQTDATVQVSADFITALKKGQNAEDYVDQFSKMSQDDLSSKLDNDYKKLAFWINVYNGFIQYKLKQNPMAYEDRRAFFGEPQIEIAGRTMSFADIEHGIIRRSQMELFLGYLSNPFAPGYQKALRPDKKDYRIHFALNCGATSCPPVAVYTDDNFDSQINTISNRFLASTTSYDETTDHAKVVALFSWFRGDFGGGEGIRDILVNYEVVPKRPENVSITEYDWTLNLDNWWD